ncbi:hypothetical protein CesoFtcFv8_017671 [Champsocephalus esox]|uniref:Uncharacterized protein n=1 Tax=Champsocephalus esox TaxID=159716 RepID=A0AAN8GQH0_9TELE|nr:hypothetical protein CesoFtcFv8_017671 [Champsocephalus esox]
MRAHGEVPFLCISGAAEILLKGFSAGVVLLWRNQSERLALCGGLGSLARSFYPRGGVCHANDAQPAVR